MDSLIVAFGKLAFRVEGSDGGAKLRHGVKVAGEVVQHGDDVVRQGCTLIPFLSHMQTTQNNDDSWHKDTYQTT